MTIIIVKMAEKRSFTIIYDPEVSDHLRAIEKKYHPLIRAAAEQQLRVSPDLETRNRKPLKRPADFDAEWELRFGPGNRFRLFYAVDRVRREVQVLAIGVKEGNRLSIGGEEITI
jgi:hypothetical protein